MTARAAKGLREKVPTRERRFQPETEHLTRAVFFDLTDPYFTGEESSWRPFCCSSGSAGPRAELDICRPVSCTIHVTKKSYCTLNCHNDGNPYTLNIVLASNYPFITLYLHSSHTWPRNSAGEQWSKNYA